MKEGRDRSEAAHSIVTAARRLSGTLGRLPLP